jgi:hypothetical protein
MSKLTGVLNPRIRTETIIFVVLLFIGIVMLPAAVFYVGQAVFGTYAGEGYSDFFGSVSAKLRGFDGVAWFLVLSPYLVWQCLRLMLFAWRNVLNAK